MTAPATCPLPDAAPASAQLRILGAVQVTAGHVKKG